MKAELFRNTLKSLKDDILHNIKTLVEKQPNAYIKVDDNRGSLVVNVIDDQESEVIQSVTYKGFRGQEILLAWYGVYEEDNTLILEECNVEMLLNILDAVETAIE
jgi:hypothetical protein